MSKTRNILHGAAALMIFIVGPAMIEAKPLWAFGAIAVAAVCVRIVEKGAKKRGRR